MAWKSLLQNTNAGNEECYVFHVPKLQSSKSSASEKAEDIGDWEYKAARHLRTSSAQSGYAPRFILRSGDDTMVEYDSDYTSTSSFEFNRGDRRGVLTSCLKKGVPSKWGDAEKWLVSALPRNSHAMQKTKSAPLHGQRVIGSESLDLAHNDEEYFSQDQLVQTGYRVVDMETFSSKTQASMDVLHCDHSQGTATSCNDGSWDCSGECARASGITSGIQIGACTPQSFTFNPIPISSPKSRSMSHPLSDEVDDMKEVKVSYETSHDDALSKPIANSKKLTMEHVESVMLAPAVRSVSMRDMGTEMTPIASQEPSRTGTPIRATTPTGCSPVSSCSSTPGRVSRAASPPEGHRDAGFTDVGHKDAQGKMGSEVHRLNCHSGKVGTTSWASKEEEDAISSKLLKNMDLEEVKKSVLETRAAAWEEAEKAKYIASFKQEEAKIQAWENHQKAKAEAEVRRIEIKVERIRARAHEKLMRKRATARRKAEEQRVLAEARKCDEAAKTAESADYIRRTGRIPYALFRCGLCGQ